MHLCPSVNTYGYDRCVWYVWIFYISGLCRVIKSRILATDLVTAGADELRVFGRS